MSDFWVCSCGSENASSAPVCGMCSCLRPDPMRRLARVLAQLDDGLIETDEALAEIRSAVARWVAA